MTDKAILQKLMKEHQLDTEGLALRTGIPPFKVQRILEGSSNLDRMAIGTLIVGFDLPTTCFDFGTQQGMDYRFEVYETFHGYQLLDRVTSKSTGLSDGVDAITIEDTHTGALWNVPAGTQYLPIVWTHDVNQEPDEILEAYWPEQYKKEHDARPLLPKAEDTGSSA